MYEVDNKDQVIEIGDVPQSSVGAPVPIVLADEYRVCLAYYLQDQPEEETNSELNNEQVTIIKFNSCYAHMFGPPNDEVFERHPLSSRGLHPYGVFEIKNSSWLRKLEVLNSVHPDHDKDKFIAGKHHFVFSFHDSTFECIAKSFDVEIKQGLVKGMIPYMLKLLND